MKPTNLQSAVGIALFSALGFLVTASCKKEKSVFAVADFSFAGNISNLPATVQFTNKSIGLSYIWDFGDGSSSTAESPSHNYNQYGLYTVKLIAQGTNNVDTMVLDIAVGSTLGQIGALNCEGAIINRTIKIGDVLNQHPVLVPYNGGNGGVYNRQIITSTGVTGLTATLTAGILASGAGNLEYKLTGTPQTFGQAKFNLSINGVSCDLIVFVIDSAGPMYPPNTVHCHPNTPTAIVDVTNPITGKIWMDRNLGARRVAISSTDTLAYGDLYQWGRRADGHQCRNAPTTNILSSTDQPLHGSFITSDTSVDWRSPQNTNLWQGVNGVNNPCPSGYRLPTETELNAERLSWSSNNTAGAFASPLKLPLAGARDGSRGVIFDVGRDGSYWSSTFSSTNSQSQRLHFGVFFGSILNYPRSNGSPIRCIKD